MLTIRLSRIGKRKKPMYRLIISEKARDPYGRALEILGSYNPFTKTLEVKKERIEHWLSVGAQMSSSVNNLLIEKEIIKGEKIKASKPGKKKKATESAEATSASEKKEAAEVTQEAPAEEKAETPAEEKKEDAPAEEKTEEAK